MTRPAMLLGTLLFLLCGGCTNYLYQGELTARDACGNERHFLVYWTKTDPLIGLPETSPAHLLAECSPDTSIAFNDQPDGIVFRGVPGADRLPGPDLPLNPDQECARVEGFSSLGEVGPGKLPVTFYCIPAGLSAGSTPARNYPAARREPYLFPITERLRHFSWRREPFAAPAPPICRGTGS